LVNRVGNEAAWWKDAGIDPLKEARKLWEHTRAREESVKPETAKDSAPPASRSQPKDVESLPPA
jgi:hypothetical protein